MRCGTGIIDMAARVLRGSSTQRRTAALVSFGNASSDLIDELAHQLSDADLVPEKVVLESDCPTRSLEMATALYGHLGSLHITADDLVVCVGDADQLSLASWACTQWCGGVQLAMVPLDLAALIEVPVLPRAIDAGGLTRALSCRPSTKFVLADVDCMDMATDSETTLLARAHMVATAMCDSERGFSTLWDRAEDIANGLLEPTLRQTNETLKARGRIMASTALVTRQSIAYGQSFAHAVAGLVPADVPMSTLLAEAMRFQARISAGEGKLAVDDVLAQDELLDVLGLGYVTTPIDPDELVAALRNERFLRTNRFLLELPRALGRVRLAAVNDEMLSEHAAAWCASRG